MGDASIPQAAPPPPTGPNTRAKGKARDDPPPSTKTQQPRFKKGRKRLASPDITDEDEEGELTPKKSDVSPDVPHLQVDEPSPPRPAQRARTESSVLVATGEVSLPFAWLNPFSAHIRVRDGVAHARRRATQSAGLKVVQDVSPPPVSTALCRGGRVPIPPHHGQCPSLRLPICTVRPSHPVPSSF